jgi:hypothetical protein
VVNCENLLLKSFVVIFYSISELTTSCWKRTLKVAVVQGHFCNSLIQENQLQSLEGAEKRLHPNPFLFKFVNLFARDQSTADQPNNLAGSHSHCKQKTSL